MYTFTCIYLYINHIDTSQCTFPLIPAIINRALSNLSLFTYMLCICKAKLPTPYYSNHGTVHVHVVAAFQSKTL